MSVIYERVCDICYMSEVIVSSLKCARQENTLESSQQATVDVSCWAM